MEGEKQTLTTGDLAGTAGNGQGSSPDEPRASGEQATREQASEAEGAEAGSPAPAGASTDAERSEPLLSAEETETFSRSWAGIQAGFVDEPRRSLEQADALVAEVMQRLAARFSAARTSLEAQWDRGDDVSTEELRVALTRYRSFFERLLAA